ncbi:Fic family protein [Cecembia sp.]|nr:Fic family protein [Cecembia sp.]
MLGELINYLCLKEKAGAILESIVKNHPFLDGTKRTGFDWQSYLRNYVLL